MADLMTHNAMMNLFKEAAEEHKIENIEIKKQESSSSILSTHNIVIEKDRWGVGGYTVFVNFHKILQRWVAYGEVFENEDEYKETMNRFKKDFADVLSCVSIFVIEDEKGQKQIQSKSRSAKCRRIVLGEGKEEKKEEEAGKMEKREPLDIGTEPPTKPAKPAKASSKKKK